MQFVEASESREPRTRNELQPEDLSDLIGRRLDHISVRSLVLPVHAGFWMQPVADPGGGHGPPKPNQDNFFAECTRNAIMSLKWKFFSSAQPLQTIRTAKYNQF